MESACAVLIFFGAIFAFLFARNLSVVAMQAISRQKILINACAVNQTSAIFRAGAISQKLAKNVSDKLLKVNYFRETASNLTTLLLLRGERATLEQSASLLVVCAVLAGVLAIVLTQSPVFMVCFMVLGIVLTSTICHNRLDTYAHQIRTMVPDALRSMSACANSGLSLMQTLEQTSEECTGSLAKVFKGAANRMKIGATTAQALSLLESIKEVPELKFVSVALQVQHVSGGSITPVLEAARGAVLSEIDLLRTLRIQTVQAKMSAAIVTVMPFLLLALFSFMSPDFLSPFFSSPIGVVMLIVALGMQGAGVWCVRRILRSE